MMATLGLLDLAPSSLCLIWVGSLEPGSVADCVSVAKDILAGLEVLLNSV